MYIERPKLEKEFDRKLNETQHIIVYGDSGSGKSWLYKQVLNKNNIKYKIINLCTASTYGSISQVLKDEVNNNEFKEKRYTETKGAEGGLTVLKANLAHEKHYVLMEDNPLYMFMDKYCSGSKQSIICFENLEIIFQDEELMKELGNLIILLDDDKYSNYNTKFIIIGVPADVSEYYTRTKNLESISNRLSELSEVSNLNIEQVREFVTKGFINELKIDLRKHRMFKKYYEHIYHVTNGAPQKLHEYCLELAYLCEDNKWIPRKEFLIQTNKKWLKNKLHKNYTAIANLMNSDGTIIGRKNQVLYTIGEMGKNNFTSTELEIKLKGLFPKSCEKVTINLADPLKTLTNNRILKKVSGRYMIIDMQYVICIRAMLVKLDNEKIQRLDINTCLDMSLKSLYKIIKVRWDIENRVFNNLKSEAALDHCFVHGGNAVEAILYFIFISSNLFQLFKQRRIKNYVPIQKELVRLLLKGLYLLKYDKNLVFSSG